MDKPKKVDKDKDKGKSDKKDEKNKKPNPKPTQPTEPSKESTHVGPQRTGYLEMRDPKNNWRSVFCILTGGSFYYYKNSTEPEPMGAVHLKADRVVFIESLENEKKQHNFAFKKQDPDTLVFVGSFSAARELQCWKKDIEAASQLPKTEPPASRFKMGAVEGKNKKNPPKGLNLTSRVLKKVILNEDKTATLNALKNLVKADSKEGPKKADDLEKALIKIGSKSYLLLQTGSLKASDFLPADRLLRSAFELLVKVYSYGRKRGQKEAKDHDKIIGSALERVENQLKATEKLLKILLDPYIKDKHRNYLSFIFNEIGNKAFLHKVLTDTVFSTTPSPERQKHVSTLVEAMENYTQFHYHM